MNFIPEKLFIDSTNQVLNKQVGPGSYIENKGLILRFPSKRVSDWNYYYNNVLCEISNAPGNPSFYVSREDFLGILGENTLNNGEVTGETFSLEFTSELKVMKPKAETFNEDYISVMKEIDTIAGGKGGNTSIFKPGWLYKAKSEYYLCLGFKTPMREFRCTWSSYSHTENFRWLRFDQISGFDHNTSNYTREDNYVFLAFSSTNPNIEKILLKENLILDDIFPKCFDNLCFRPSKYRLYAKEIKQIIDLSGVSLENYFDDLAIRMAKQYQKRKKNSEKNLEELTIQALGLPFLMHSEEIPPFTQNEKIVQDTIKEIFVGDYLPVWSMNDVKNYFIDPIMKKWN